VAPQAFLVSSVCYLASATVLGFEADPWAVEPTLLTTLLCCPQRIKCVGLGKWVKAMHTQKNCPRNAYVPE
jgi:hypothetical protein